MLVKNNNTDPHYTFFAVMDHFIFTVLQKHYFKSF